jgi:hypothetical protein
VLGTTQWELNMAGGYVVGCRFIGNDGYDRIQSFDTEALGNMMAGVSRLEAARAAAEAPQASHAAVAVAPAAEPDDQPATKTLLATLAGLFKRPSALN